MLVDAKTQPVPCAQAIPVQSFQRESPTNEIPPWTVQADIWYSERVVDMKDDIPKWCALRRGCMPIISTLRQA